MEYFGGLTAGLSGGLAGGLAAGVGSMPGWSRSVNAWERAVEDLNQ